VKIVNVVRLKTSASKAANVKGKFVITLMAIRRRRRRNRIL